MLLSGFLLPLTVTYYTMIFISQVLVKCLTNEKIERDSQTTVRNFAKKMPQISA